MAMEDGLSAQRVDSLRLVWLQAFIKVAECASHTAAGKELGWDQSTVSRYIKRLEEWLGKELFTGFVSPVLTKHGKTFLPVAMQVMELLANSRTTAAAKRKRPATTALALELNRSVLKKIFVAGPQPGSREAKEKGVSDEFLKQARQEYIKLVQGNRPRTISGADIDMSFYTNAKAKEDK